MSRENLEKEGITLLGNQKVKYPDNYAPEVLETFLNKHPDNDYFVKFNCPEFTSLCPITGQPDFATITISYVPGERMVESKSLKLYLFSFRNHGDFHEDCMNVIMKDLIRLMDPKYIEVWGKFTPRGGISIDPYCNYGKPYFLHFLFFSFLPQQANGSASLRMVRRLENHSYPGDGCRLLSSRSAVIHFFRIYIVL